MDPVLASNLENSPSSKYFLNKKYLFVLLCVLTALGFIYFLLLGAPRDFPQGVIVNVEEGSSLRSVSLKMQELNIIKSRTVFEAFVILYGGEKHIIPADYLFEGRVPVFEVARRVSVGDRGLAPIKVTIPEGFDVMQVAEAFSRKLPSFNSEKFLAEARAKEGYLFPDTYFFFSTDNEQTALKSLAENFEKKIKPLRKDIVASGKSERDIIIMASVIEREAKGNHDRELISGILWRRLSIGMPLQADAAPETYESKGLPKNPIANPGLLAIKSAIFPAVSPYLYYLHDKEGNIHFARSFEEHRKNIDLYLK